MADPIPLNQSSRDIILFLINRDNSTSETFESVSFGTVTPQPNGSLRNTAMVVSAVAGSGRTGSVTVHYNRLDISTLFNVNPLPVPDMVAETSYEFINYLNTTYGIHLNEEDIVLENVTENPYQLKIHANSYAWTGTLNIQITEEDEIPAGTYLNLGNGSLFGVEDGVLLNLA